jgi:hypothetical protein
MQAALAFEINASSVGACLKTACAKHEDVRLILRIYFTGQKTIVWTDAFTSGCVCLEIAECT